MSILSELPWFRRSFVSVIVRIPAKYKFPLNTILNRFLQLFQCCHNLKNVHLWCNHLKGLDSGFVILFFEVLIVVSFDDNYPKQWNEITSMHYTKLINTVFPLTFHYLQKYKAEMLAELFFKIYFLLSLEK